MHSKQCMASWVSSTALQVCKQLEKALCLVLFPAVILLKAGEWWCLLISINVGGSHVWPKPLKTIKWVKKKKCKSLAFSHTPVQSRCFPSPVFLPLLCSIWLVTLPLVLSTDSSLGSDSQSVENTRSRLKCSRGVEPYQMPGMSLMSQTGSETSTSCHTNALEICGPLPFHPSFYHPFTASLA